MELIDQPYPPNDLPWGQNRVYPLDKGLSPPTSEQGTSMKYAEK
jgi:hypothetical protein